MGARSRSDTLTLLAIRNIYMSMFDDISSSLICQNLQFCWSQTSHNKSSNKCCTGLHKMAIPNWESQYNVQSCFLDIQLTSLLPWNCFPPEVILHLSRQPTWSVSEKALVLLDNVHSNILLALSDEVFSTWMAFGGNIRDLGSFGEETDKITDLHQDSPRSIVLRAWRRRHRHKVTPS
ncbi:hypothetical protein Tco_0726154 [Tanacetum coccineum]|uniref:Uncharacterized protein n=1 Tax=Tanacetum coccineum TaxID=301880 RepID=A0ABQ4YEV7_9ASTR